MVNWDRVRALRSEVEEEDFEEILELFFSEIEAALAQFSDLREPEKLAGLLHFIKSGALNLGFDELSDICDAGERSALMGVAEVSTTALKDTYHRSKTQFLGDIDRQLSG